MDKINQTYDSLIEKLMTKSAKENKSELDSELIKKIPFTDTYTNSITIAAGKQRSGKTRKIIKEIIKISKLHKDTHMLLYVNKTGTKSDKTFESFNSLIEVPIEYCAQDDCEEKLNELITYKNFYNEVKANGWEEQISEEQISDVFEKLHIEDFSRPYLHTLVLLDDIANSKMLTKKTSYINSLLTQCAHINMSFFLCIQYWAALPTSIKSQVSTIYLFGGFPKQQFTYALQQITLSEPIIEIYKKYKTLRTHDYMSIYVPDGEYTITISDYNEKDDKNKEKQQNTLEKQINREIKKEEKSLEQPAKSDSSDEEISDDDLIKIPEKGNIEADALFQIVKQQRKEVKNIKRKIREQNKRYK